MFSELVYIRHSDGDFFVYFEDLGANMEITILRFKATIEISKQDWLGMSRIGEVSLAEFRGAINAPMMCCCGVDLGICTSSKQDIMIPKLIDGYIKIETHDFLRISREFKNNSSFAEYSCYTKIYPLSLYTKVVDIDSLGNGLFNYLSNLIKKVVSDKEYQCLLLTDMENFSDGVIV